MPDVASEQAVFITIMTNEGPEGDVEIGRKTPLFLQYSSRWDMIPTTAPIQNMARFYVLIPPYIYKDGFSSILDKRFPKSKKPSLCLLGFLCRGNLWSRVLFHMLLKPDHFLSMFNGRIGTLLARGAEEIEASGRWSSGPNLLLQSQ